MQTAVGLIVDQVREATHAQTPLRICGAGSKAFYKARGAGDRLSTAALRGVHSYEPSELVVTVGAGTPLSELEQTLAQHRQYLPFEPPHFAWSQAKNPAGTVGGMVATGLAGPARASVGGVRDYVLGLKLINGQGQLLNFGGQVIKNVAGYDVSRLMVGAMGTLGLIAEVTLKVMPVPPGEATLRFSVPQHEALEHLHRWGSQALPLNASCWLAAQDAPPYGLLTLRLRGAESAVQAATRNLLQQAKGHALPEDEAQAFWDACRHQHLDFFSAPQALDHVLWRLSLPATAPVLPLPSAPCVEWHGALRWLWAPLDAASALHALCQAAGGTASVFVAKGQDVSLAGGIYPLQTEASQRIQERLQLAFDPQGVFNPGCIP